MGRKKETAATLRNGGAGPLFNVVEILKSGAIAISGAVPGQLDGFDSVESATSFLNTFGTTVAQHIRERFGPLPSKAKQSPSNRCGSRGVAWWRLQNSNL